MQKFVDGKLVPMTETEITEREAEQARDEADALPQWRSSASIPKGVFCERLMDAGILTPAEAVLAAQGGWPAKFDAALSALPAIDAARAQMKWAAAVTVRRNHPTLAALAKLAKLTDAQVDALFAGPK